MSRQLIAIGAVILLLGVTKLVYPRMFSLYLSATDTDPSESKERSILTWERIEALAPLLVGAFFLYAGFQT